VQRHRDGELHPFFLQLDFYTKLPEPSRMSWEV